jgi:hypothetical protein
MTNPLDSRNPHGIRVAANRGPVREDAKAAFEQASRAAANGIARLTQPRARQRTTAARHRAAQ